MPKYVCASTAAEHISDCLKIPLGELVDVFADIQSADVVRWCGVRIARNGMKFRANVLTGMDSVKTIFAATAREKTVKRHDD